MNGTPSIPSPATPVAPHDAPADGVAADTLAAEEGAVARRAEPNARRDGAGETAESVLRQSRFPAALAVFVFFATVAFTAGMVAGGGPLLFDSKFLSMIVYAWVFPVLGIIVIYIYYKRAQALVRRGQLSTTSQLDSHLGEERYDAASNLGAYAAAECSICLEEFVDGARTRVLPCQHRFHLHCVDQWLLINRHKPTCPLCNLDVRGPSTSH